MFDTSVVVTLCAKVASTYVCRSCLLCICLAAKVEVLQAPHLVLSRPSIISMMASVRTALFLLPPVSVLLVAAVRCLCRVAARKLSALARAQFPSGGSSSSPSFRYYLPVGVEKQGGDAAMRELPVALYYRRRRSCCGEEQDEEQQQAAECVFCLSVIEEGSEVREVKCRHLFHRCCLDRWLLARPLATCPLCRCRLLAAARAPWEEDYGEGEDSDSDMMLFMACVHSRSSWLWPS